MSTLAPELSLSGKLSPCEGENEELSPRDVALIETFNDHDVDELIETFNTIDGIKNDKSEARVSWADSEDMPKRGDSQGNMSSKPSSSWGGSNGRDNGSIRKSNLPSKRTQDLFDMCKAFTDQTEIKMEDVFAAVESKERAEKQNRQLKVLLLSLTIAVILLCAGAFASSFAAVQLSKESHISEGGAMVDLNSATDGKNIVQIAPSVDSKLNLFHALVLDQAHLRTMDEVVYTYYPNGYGNKTRTRTDKVFRVERDVGEDPLDVNVTITLMDFVSKIVIAPKEEDPMLLLTDGDVYSLCGQMRCSNFKVDDPNLDIKLLDQKVNQVFGEDGTDSDEMSPNLDNATSLDHLPNASQGGGRRAWAFSNYGCCSMALGFVIGIHDDYAKCNSYSQYKKLHNGMGPSNSCYGHDMCLTRCDRDDPTCTCWGKCDVKLKSSAYYSSCKTKWWQCYKKAECVARRKVIQWVMSTTPNGCDANGKSKW